MRQADGHQDDGDPPEIPGPVPAIYPVIRLGHQLADAVGLAPPTHLGLSTCNNPGYRGFSEHFWLMPPSLSLIARDQRILAGYRAGATVRQIALSEEVDPAIVRRVLRSSGIAVGPLRELARDPNTARLTDSDWLRAEYAAKGAHEIAQELGYARDAVYASALRAAGIPRRVPREYESIARGVELWSAETADEVIERYVTGESAPMIAKALAVPRGRVYTLLRERGVLRSLSEAREIEEVRRRLAAKQERATPSNLPDMRATARPARGRTCRRPRSSSGMPPESRHRQSPTSWGSRRGGSIGCCGSAVCSGRWAKQVRY